MTGSDESSRKWHELFAIALFLSYLPGNAAIDLCQTSSGDAVNRMLSAPVWIESMVQGTPYSCHSRFYGGSLNFTLSGN